MTCLKRLALTLAVLALLPSAARAQAVGGASISGTVKDTSGAVLPGVSVEAARARFSSKRSGPSTTDASGQYKIENLRPGIVFGHVHAGRVQHGQARGHRAGGHVRRHDQRRSDAVGNVSETITVTQREPDRRPPELAAAARLLAGSPGRDSGRPQPHQRDRPPAGRERLPAGARRPAGRRRHEQPPEHHLLDPRRPHERHAPAARRRPARQRAVARRVLQLRARHRRDAGDDGRLRRHLGGAGVRRPAHQPRAEGRRQHLQGVDLRHRRELRVAVRQPDRRI